MGSRPPSFSVALLTTDGIVYVKYMKNICRFAKQLLRSASSAKTNTKVKIKAQINLSNQEWSLN